MTLAGLVAHAYPSPAWATFFEVSNSTGHAASRRADAIALGVWPSRGHQVIGFEFKEDRRDWLKELKSPAKAEAIVQHCDEWWVVIGKEGIAKPEELPAPWGLKVASPKRDRLLTVKPCVPFDRDTATIRRSFVASMLRKVTETTVPKAEVDRLVSERVAALPLPTPPGHHALEQAHKRIATLEARIHAFEARSGIHMDSWTPAEDLGKAVHALLRLDTTAQTIRNVEASLATSHQRVKDTMALLAQLSREREEQRHG